ncbi:rhomboid family intramembrane serine protease [uncultured Dysosmobacter sp.]|uniref:rhomboid family intramembrane serine protease n=1 Tax=uncultured Dysosmobacter sp. TaxID=2591384 RepID=UPI002618976D|nr:rhomboid family intramembrane serine protease [uncultured Dysosmobacter sp.]
MRKLNAAVDRFAYNHPRFGIPNLMRYIVFGNALVYLLAVFAGYNAVSFLEFNWLAIKSGELWRLVTFIFMPGYSSSRQVIWLLFFLYLYYMIGTTLEREWGTAKFSLYYLSGVVLTVAAGVIMALVTGQNVFISGAGYVNLSLFFAFAMLYPDTRFLILYIIPVKVKWLAWLDAAVFALSVLTSLLHLDLVGALLPVIALLNFFVFFWTNISDEISYRRGRTRHQSSHQTIQFKAAVRQQRKKEAEQGYRHKCSVCGRTDTDFPDLEFRYCSRCAGYHCFCQDHINNHVHFTE